MSPQIIDESAFAEVLSRTGWADIDTFYMACKEANVFGSEFYDRAIERAMKAEIRRRLRSGKIRGADGQVIRVASIVMVNKKGQEQRVYKQETLFDVGDCVQVVQYWRGSVARSEQRLEYYINLAIKLHGAQIQGMLGFRD